MPETTWQTKSCWRIHTDGNKTAEPEPAQAAFYSDGKALLLPLGPVFHKTLPGSSRPHPYWHAEVHNRPGFARTSSGLPAGTHILFETKQAADAYAAWLKNNHEK